MRPHLLHGVPARVVEAQRTRAAGQEQGRGGEDDAVSALQHGAGHERGGGLRWLNSKEKGPSITRNTYYYTTLRLFGLQ